jgi:AraC family transcriptional regulator, positive regulator of tynA and feaB
MQKVLTTADVLPRDRLAFWYDVASKVFADHEFSLQGPSTFNATLHHAALGQIEIIHVDGAGIRQSTRSAAHIAHVEDDVFFLCLQVSGNGALSQDGRDAAIGPGDFALLDAQRPNTARFAEAYKQIVLKIPHRALKARLTPSSQLTARAVQHTEGLGGLVSEYIRLLPSRIALLQPMEKARIAEQVLDLVALSLASHSTDERPSLSSARAVALLQLRTVIEARLHDPSLDPEAAAAAAGISVRYANALLGNEGMSLQRLIVSRRLDRCRRALEDPAQAHRSIGEIAYAWGFSNVSHFTRRFKAAFGSAPRDYRAAHQA